MHFNRRKMKINLVTDAKYHNLALMKMATLQKANGHEIYLNGVGHFDMTIGSWLFDWSPKPPCDYEGGPGIDPAIRNEWCDTLRPDYSLFNLNYSLGYTWEYCPRKCSFCIVPKQNNPKRHHSIWDFHDSRFKKICLMNNNTFSDPQWRETFEEIWDADLIVKDEQGYDLRLLDEEKAEALKKTKWEKKVHFAWDLMKDEAEIIRGMELVKKHRLHNGMVYVLVGFDTTEDEDFYRLQKIHDYKLRPYVMPYNKKNRHLYTLKCFIDLRAYTKYPSIKEAWESYRYKE